MPKRFTIYAKEPVQDGMITGGLVYFAITQLFDKMGIPISLSVSDDEAKDEGAKCPK